MPATWVHSSLAVSDLDVAVAFYMGAFGCEMAFHEELAAEIEAMTGVSGMRCRLAQLRMPRNHHVLELIEFHAPAGAEQRSPAAVGHGHVAFRAEDFDAALARVEAMGAERVGEVVPFPEGRAVYLREPAGSIFEITEIDPDAIA